jgi:hypothetical protein
MAKYETSKSRTKKKNQGPRDTKPLTDSELEEFVDVLWENIDAVPGHIQALLYDSQDPSTVGAVSYMLAAGWAIGKLDYVPANFWDGTKGGWVSKEEKSN